MNTILELQSLLLAFQESPPDQDMWVALRTLKKQADTIQKNLEEAGSISATFLSQTAWGKAQKAWDCAKEAWGVIQEVRSTEEEIRKQMTWSLQQLSDPQDVQKIENAAQETIRRCRESAYKAAIFSCRASLVGCQAAALAERRPLPRTSLSCAVKKDVEKPRQNLIRNLCIPPELTQEGRNALIHCYTLAFFAFHEANALLLTKESCLQNEPTSAELECLCQRAKTLRCELDTVRRAREAAIPFLNAQLSIHPNSLSLQRAAKELEALPPSIHSLQDSLYALHCHAFAQRLTLLPGKISEYSSIAPPLCRSLVLQKMQDMYDSFNATFQELAEQPTCDPIFICNELNALETLQTKIQEEQSTMDSEGPTQWQIASVCAEFYHMHSILEEYALRPDFLDRLKRFPAMYTDIKELLFSRWDFWCERAREIDNEARRALIQLDLQRNHPMDAAFCDLRSLYEDLSQITQADLQRLDGIQKSAQEILDEQKARYKNAIRDFLSDPTESIDEDLKNSILQKLGLGTALPQRTHNAYSAAAIASMEGADDPFLIQCSLVHACPQTLAQPIAHACRMNRSMDEILHAKELFDDQMSIRELLDIIQGLDQWFLQFPPLSPLFTAALDHLFIDEELFMNIEALLGPLTSQWETVQNIYCTLITRYLHLLADHSIHQLKTSLPPLREAAMARLSHLYEIWEQRIDRFRNPSSPLAQKTQFIADCRHLLLLVRAKAEDEYNFLQRENPADASDPTTKFGEIQHNLDRAISALYHLNSVLENHLFTPAFREKTQRFPLYAKFSLVNVKELHSTAETILQDTKYVVEKRRAMVTPPDSDEAMIVSDDCCQEDEIECSPASTQISQTDERMQMHPWKRQKQCEPMPYTTPTELSLRRTPDRVLMREDLSPKIIPTPRLLEAFRFYDDIREKTITNYQFLQQLCEEITAQVQEDDQRRQRATRQWAEDPIHNIDPNIVFYLQQ